MKTKIVRIGNSRGIRIPKTLLKEVGLEDEVEMIVRRGSLIVRPASRTRQGWEEAFRRMAAAGDDRLLDGDSGPLTRWDGEEWRW